MSGRRRGRGEGSIVLRADGRWMARVDLGWQSGRRCRKPLYGKTRKDVADKLNAALQQLRSGGLSSGPSQTLGRFVADWLTSVAKPRVRPRTWATYESVIRLQIAPYLERVRLSRLSPQHVQSWLGTLEAKGVSAHRRRYARVVLRAALNTAQRWGLVTLNAAALVDPPRSPHREAATLSLEQAKGLLKTAEGDPLQAFVTVALSCGLRVGEALGLRWGDVDLASGALTVRQAAQRAGGDQAARRPLLAERSMLRKRIAEGVAALGPAGDRHELTAALAKIRQQLSAVRSSIQFVEPKSARSRRTIALPSVTVAALRNHKRRQLETRLVAGERWKDHGLVFATSVGTPMETSNLTKHFKALLKRAGLPSIRIHDLRHTATTLLLSQGVSARVVMETLGHSQISLTMNTYSHVLPELQREAATRMDAALGS